MSEVKEWYKNAWYTPTMKKIKEEVDGITEDVSNVKEEVTDIRLGVDGVTYSSAGDAVRSQINLALEAMRNALLNFYGTAIKIQTGTDFNTLKTYGSYYYPNGSYTNAPSASGALIVHKTITNQLMHIALSTDNNVFTRTYDGTTWSIWKNLAIELPDFPTEDGDYVLMASVNDGVVNTSWGTPTGGNAVIQSFLEMNSQSAEQIG